MTKSTQLILLFVLITHLVWGQQSVLKGKVTYQSKPLEGARVLVVNGTQEAVTQTDGTYRLPLSPGTYEIAAFFYGFKTEKRTVKIEDKEQVLDFRLVDISKTLEELIIKDEEQKLANIQRLNAVEGAGIYEAKKTEVILPDQLAANLATNNSRQIYAKVPGLNIWENDYAGLQLALGARGLDPNRTAHFNVRQNGYDISADALGYPESYYTPPAEAIDRIQVVRGAASLQYGTQFGGLLNFVLKEGPAEKKIEFSSRQTIGSFGLFNSFNSLGGTVGKFNYYTFYQHKQGNGWRKNSRFDLDMFYTSLNYQINPDLKITGQYSGMQYLAQQPGGLTDALFAQNPRQSIRERNWFQVNWNLMSLILEYRISDQVRINIRNFGLIGGRDALGNLQRIDRVDVEAERDLFVDDFFNFGNESRLIWNYQWGDNPMVLLIGTRFYQGFTHRRQGLGPDGREADFRFLNPQNLEGSDFDFPGNNFSIFAEHIFNLSPKWSLTPGIRLEHIVTRANGYYQDQVLVPDPVTGFARDSVFQVPEDKNNPRTFIFGGLGVSYKRTEHLEFYGNFSQNYRSINFNDIRVDNENIVVDPDISDERGYNIDLGARGGKDLFYDFDVSFFWLHYQDRIGQLLKRDENFRVYRFRTNAGNSRHLGFEGFAQVNLLYPFHLKDFQLYWFTNLSLIEAEYIYSEDHAIEGNQVELTPPFMLRTGLEARYKQFNAAFNFAHVQQHFSDATNAANVVPSAVEGIIPTYQVMDLSLNYEYQFLQLAGGINNLMDARYFTRRASGYPGPGIIPADGRNFYLTVGFKL